MSVHLGDILEEEGREPGSVIDGQPHSLVGLSAELVRQQEQTVRRTPTVEDASHGEVHGKKPKARCRMFARAAQFHVLKEEHLQADVKEKVDAARRAEE